MVFQENGKSIGQYGITLSVFCMCMYVHTMFVYVCIHVCMYIHMYVYVYEFNNIQFNKELLTQ